MLAEILFHGRLASRIEDAHGAVKAIDSDIVQAAKEARISPEEMTADVNEYAHRDEHAGRHEHSRYADSDEHADEHPMRGLQRRRQGDDPGRDDPREASR